MPDDDEVRSEVLEDADGEDYVVEQENTGPGNMKGGGEWPDPDAPAEAPAPGTVASEDAAIKNERHGDRPESNAEVDSAAPLKTVLEADPVAGGSKSTPD